MDYIDPEEEFEMMHADELQMMNEMEFENNGNLYLNLPKWHILILNTNSNSNFMIIKIN